MRASASVAPRASVKHRPEQLTTFAALRAKDPDYVAMYLMAGQILVEKGDKAEAIVWLDQGLAVAEKKRDSHAAGEIASLRDSLV